MASNLWLGVCALRYKRARMIYIKSMCSGILAVILTPLLLLIGLLIYSRSLDFIITWDVGGLKSPVFWIAVTLIFAVGYIWEYRRLSKRISS